MKRLPPSPRGIQEVAVTVHVEKAPLTWLVVADDARARIFSFGDKLKPWVLVHDFTLHGNNELRDAVTHEALPGHHEPPTTPHRLGHELVHFLDHHGKAHDFTQLVFVAPPHMLGFLRGHVSSTLEQALLASFAKEYGHLDEPKLREHLSSLLPA
jgi:protein required for attachment to host cells